MKNNRLILFLKSIKEDMVPMSKKERLEHIWLYFKWHIIAVLCTVMITISILSDITIGLRMETWGAAAINVQINDVGLKVLGDDYLDYLDLDVSTNNVELYNPGFQGLNTSELNQNYQLTLSFTTMIGAQKTDFIFMDQEAIDYYADQLFYLDLREIFSDTELQAISDQIVYHYTSNGTPYPIGICIDDLPFTKECIISEDPVYLLFAVNSKHSDSMVSVYRYLSTWQLDS